MRSLFGYERLSYFDGFLVKTLLLYHITTLALKLVVVA